MTPKQHACALKFIDTYGHYRKGDENQFLFSAKSGKSTETRNGTYFVSYNTIICFISHSLDVIESFQILYKYIFYRSIYYYSREVSSPMRRLLQRAQMRRRPSTSMLEYTGKLGNHAYHSVPFCTILYRIIVNIIGVITKQLCDNNYF